MPCALSLLDPLWTYYAAGYLACMVFSAMYVWMDLAQEHISLNVLLKNTYFYLYWLLQLIGSSLAFYLLLSYPPVKAWPSLFIAIVAVFGSSLIMQNQLIKIGDKPVLDLSGFQKALRLQAVAEAGSIIARQQKAYIVRQTELLAERYKGEPEQLEEMLARVMIFGKMEDAQIQEEIQKIKKRSETLGLPVEYEMARVIVQTDIDYATRLLYRHATKQP